MTSQADRTTRADVHPAVAADAPALDRTTPTELVETRAYVRVYSGAITSGPPAPMAEGEVIAYCAQPTLLIREPDGRQSSWSVNLPRAIVTPPEPADNTRWVGTDNATYERHDDWRATDGDDRWYSTALAAPITWAQVWARAKPRVQLVEKER